MSPRSHFESASVMTTISPDACLRASLSANALPLLTGSLISLRVMSGWLLPHSETLSGGPVRGPGVHDNYLDPVPRVFLLVNVLQLLHDEPGLVIRGHYDANQGRVIRVISVLNARIPTVEPPNVSIVSQGDAEMRGGQR
ncbi:MAG: hypothetical protein QXY20_08430 [Thermofilum sp.]